MSQNKIVKNIRIFQVFNSRTINGKEVYLARTENNVYKYFEVEKQIPWVKLVACIHADDSSDEVIYLGKIEDFKVVSEDSSCELSMEDIKIVKNNDRTIINCYRIGLDFKLKKIVLGGKFKHKIIHDYKNKYGHDIEINGNYLSETESKVIQYIEADRKYSRKYNGLDYWEITDSSCSMSISNLDKIYNDVKEQVNSLDIEAIIDSYHVKIESSHINKVGGDDTYFDYYVSECGFTDDYMVKFLPHIFKSVHGSFNPHFSSSFQEQREWWANCEEMERSAKEMARNNYNKEEHIRVLFAYKIRSITYHSLSKVNEKHDFELLKQYVDLTWGLHNPYMSIDNKMKISLAEHNKGRVVLF